MHAIHEGSRGSKSGIRKSNLFLFGHAAMSPDSVMICEQTYTREIQPCGAFTPQKFISSGCWLVHIANTAKKLSFDITKILSIYMSEA